jgi:hypothetical protein
MTSYYDDVLALPATLADTIKTTACRLLRHPYTHTHLILKDRRRRDLYNALNADVDLTVKEWIERVELELCQPERRHTLLIRATKLSVTTRRSIPWCARGELHQPNRETIEHETPSRLATMHIVACHMGRRLVYDNVPATFTAVLADGHFITAPHEQYYAPEVTVPGGVVGIITTDEADGVHACCVRKSVQTCCDKPHRTTVVTLDEIVSVLALEDSIEMQERVFVKRMQEPPVRELSHQVLSVEPETATTPQTRRGVRGRHRTIFAEARAYLIQQVDCKCSRAAMMHYLTTRPQIRALFPHKQTSAALFHAMRNVFQSSRYDRKPGDTVYTKTGMGKGNVLDDSLNNVIWMYRVHKTFIVQLIQRAINK